MSNDREKALNAKLHDFNMMKKCYLYKQLINKRNEKIPQQKTDNKYYIGFRNNNQGMKERSLDVFLEDYYRKIARATLGMPSELTNEQVENYISRYEEFLYERDLRGCGPFWNRRGFFDTFLELYNYEKLDLQ